MGGPSLAFVGGPSLAFVCGPILDFNCAPFQCDRPLLALSWMSEHYVLCVDDRESVSIVGVSSGSFLSLTDPPDMKMVYATADFKVTHLLPLCIDMYELELRFLVYFQRSFSFRVWRLEERFLLQCPACPRTCVTLR